MARHPKPDDTPHPSVLVFTRETSRELDRLATDRYGIPSIVLMENAARHVADVAVDGLDEMHHPCVLVVCGPGKNGGDGLAAARHLHNAGMRVAVLLSGPVQAEDARINYEIIRRMQVPLFTVDGGNPDHIVSTTVQSFGSPHLVIDALLGTGVTRDVEGVIRSLVEGVNTLAEEGVTVLSIDIPSGLDADTGQVRGAAVRATLTVTFAGLKAGLLALEAQPYVGEVIVADIGAPRELVEQLGERLTTQAGPGDEDEDEDTQEPPEPPVRRGHE